MLTEEIEGAVAMGDGILVVLVHLGVSLRRGGVLRLVLLARLEDRIPAKEVTGADTGRHDLTMRSTFEDNGFNVLRGGKGEDALRVGCAIIKTVQHFVQANMTTALKEPLAKSANCVSNKC